MNPLGVAGVITLPPRLALRALDDLHVIATSAREISGALDNFERRADAVVEQLNTGVDLLARIEAMGGRIEQMGGRIDARAEAILVMGAGIEETARSVLTQGSAIEKAARELARSGDALAAALPTLQRGLELAEPLEGVVERVGRMVDRLPGGSPRRSQTPPGTPTSPPATPE